MKKPGSLLVGCVFGFGLLALAACDESARLTEPTPRDPAAAGSSRSAAQAPGVGVSGYGADSVGVFEGGTGVGSGH
jgi:hypothetical protein